ncbi:MAG: endonuclease III [Blastocatellia bacterium]|nr:endonuclease III [Blastocatellia bacterium]
MIEKEPFDLDRVFEILEEVVELYPKAGLFELFAEGHRSVFELLIACMISIRTKDEVMLPVSRKLFGNARTASEMVRLGREGIERLIYSSSFHERKAGQIYKIAERLVSEGREDLPCELDYLLSLDGVGPKCANLVLGIGCGKPFIGVDIHVHRITNRWGYVETKTPEKTLAALEEKLPKRYWVDINRLLVPFGKNICTGINPKCLQCRLKSMCKQIDT